MLERALRVLLAIAGAVVMCVPAACADDEGEPRATRPSAEPTDTTSAMAPHATAALPTDPVDASEPAILRIEAPAQVECTGPDARVEVSFATQDVVAVAFVVDGRPVEGPPPPTTGVHEVAVPCDGRAHTVMLVGSGATGGAPVFATEAVVTSPA